MLRGYEEVKERGMGFDDLREGVKYLFESRESPSVGFPGLFQGYDASGGPLIMPLDPLTGLPIKLLDSRTGLSVDHYFSQEFIEDRRIHPIGRLEKVSLPEEVESESPSLKLVPRREKSFSYAS